MTATRTRRLLTGVAAAALIVSTPGFVSVAAAHPHDGKGGRAGLSSEITSNTELVTAIKDARQSYKAEVKAVKTAYRDDTAGARDAVAAATQTQRDALTAARDAYRTARRSGSDTTAARDALRSAAKNLRDAVIAARADQMDVFDAAGATAKTALAAALATYQGSIRAAFEGTGVEIPERLLTPRFKHGKDAGRWIGHGIGRTV